MQPKTRRSQPQKRLVKDNRASKSNRNPLLKAVNNKVARTRSMDEDKFGPQWEIGRPTNNGVPYPDEIIIDNPGNRRRTRGMAGAGGGIKVRDTPVMEKVEHLIKRNNEYLRELVLPEEHGPKAYPDQFESKSTTWRSIINTPLLYNETALGDTPAGAFLAVIRPTLRTPVLMQTPSTEAVLLRGYVHNQSENYGLFGLADRDPVVSQQQQEEWRRYA